VGGTPKLSTCLTDATIQIAANPVQVTLGGTSTVSWSVVLPNGCGGGHVRFNGASVARSGSCVVAPPRASRFTVVVSQTRNFARGASPEQCDPRPEVHERHAGDERNGNQDLSIHGGTPSCKDLPQKPSLTCIDGRERADSPRAAGPA